MSTVITIEADYVQYASLWTGMARAEQMFPKSCVYSTSAKQQFTLRDHSH